MLDIFKGKKKKEEDLVTSLLPKEMYTNPVLEIADIISPTALRLNSNDMNISGKFARTLFVVSYPRFLTEGWLSSIINLDKVFNVSIYSHPVETTKVLRQLQKKLASVQSEISMRREKGLVRDPKLDTAQQDIEHLRDQ